VAGFAAGAVLMVLELSWAGLSSSDGPWRISQLVAALTLGPQTLQVSPHSYDTAIVAVALATHYVLGVGFGLMLGFVIAGFRYDASLVVMLLIGAAFSVVLYLFNFYVLTGAFPWFAELRGWKTVLAHVVLGLATAAFYWKLARRGASGPRAA
jgi:ribose/xylose/arabinose/galactoside ABC-type transport system permease subunit